MRKDKLTIENIKKDTHQVYVSGYVCLGIFIAFTLLFAWLAKLCWEVGGAIGWNSVLFFVCAILFLIMVIVTIVELPKWKKLSYNKPIIVRDKLVGKDIERPVNGSGKYCFYFSSYGRYETFVDEFNKIYTWSENFSMTPQRVFDRADVNEEFYLVLDKKHSGKIISIYSNEIFELENEEEYIKKR